MSLLDESKILNICDKYYEQLMNLENVVGVGMGYKKINHITTNEVCLVVMVNKKIPNINLHLRQIIPNYYMGIKTDVIDVGSISCKSLNRGVGLNSKIRPLKGGYAIGPNARIITGTLGCIVYRLIGSSKKPIFYILSNNHILSNLNVLPLGTEILQTSYPEGGRRPRDVVARLSQFVPLKFYEYGYIPENYADCAIAEIIDKSLISSKIEFIGEIRGVRKPKLGMQVRKVGCTTGLTTGHITLVGTTINFKMHNGKYATFKNQIIADNYNDGGDSGAVMVDKDNYVVGILHAGTDVDCIFSDISTVLRLLNVKILTKR